MGDHPLATLLGAGAVLVASAFAALGPSAPFAFVWQFVVGFGFIGATLAYRLKRRTPETEEFLIVYRWSLFGLGVGVASAIVAEVLL